MYLFKCFLIFFIHPTKSVGFSLLNIYIILEIGYKSGYIYEKFFQFLIFFLQVNKKSTVIKNDALACNQLFLMMVMFVMFVMVTVIMIVFMVVIMTMMMVTVVVMVTVTAMTI